MRFADVITPLQESLLPESAPGTKMIVGFGNIFGFAIDLFIVIISIEMRKWLLWLRPNNFNSLVISYRKSRSKFQGISVSPPKAEKVPT